MASADFEINVNLDVPDMSPIREALRRDQDQRLMAQAQSDTRGIFTDRLCLDYEGNPITAASGCIDIAAESVKYRIRDGVVTIPIFQNLEAARAAHQKEQAVQRDTFTFPFKGRDIAAAIDAKIVRLIETVEAIKNADPFLLECLELSALVADRSASRLAALDREISQWSRERVGYAKASSRKFELDAADVAYFGLEA